MILVGWFLYTIAGACFFIHYELLLHPEKKGITLFEFLSFVLMGAVLGPWGWLVMALRGKLSCLNFYVIRRKKSEEGNFTNKKESQKE